MYPPHNRNLSLAKMCLRHGGVSLFYLTVMLQSGLDICPVITHRFHYTEFQNGFDAMLSGQSGEEVLSCR